MQFLRAMSYSLGAHTDALQFSPDASDDDDDDIDAAPGPKFTKVLSPNVEGVVADQVFLRCSICRSVPEIFAMKVESCQKSDRNLDVFLALGNMGADLPKVVHALSSLPRGTSSGKFSLGYSH